jgi:hypothetical protein
LQGAWNNGSNPILTQNNIYLNAFYTIAGIILANSGDESSRQGFVLIYINQGLN